jgi:hypothetical protein
LLKQQRLILSSFPAEGWKTLDKSGVGPPDKTPILNFGNLIFKAVAMSGPLPACPRDIRCATATVSTNITADVDHSSSEITGLSNRLLMQAVKS